MVTNWKIGSQVSLIVDFYIGKPKYCTKRLLELVREPGNVVEHETNTPESLSYVYPNNSMAKKDVVRSVQLN